MPTYEYECLRCGKTQEVFHGISEKPALRCACGETKQFRRLISSGAGLIFKGSGFYVTDYKNNNNAKPKQGSDSGSGKAEKPTGEKCECSKDSPCTET